MNRYKFLAKMRGVTLMELMIVIVIVSILASVAIPSYRRHLIRSQRSEAKIALLQLQTAEEKYYLQFNAFTANITGAVTSATPGLGLLNVTETNQYDISVVLGDATAQSYTATAAPRAGGGQTDDSECANFTMTDRDTRGVSGSLGTQTCWK
jgi:type IV pilus assembly protein PilE